MSDDQNTQDNITSKDSVPADEVKEENTGNIEDTELIESTEIKDGNTEDTEALESTEDKSTEGADETGNTSEDNSSQPTNTPTPQSDGTTTQTPTVTSNTNDTTDAVKADIDEVTQETEETESSEDTEKIKDVKKDENANSDTSEAKSPKTDDIPKLEDVEKDEDDEEEDEGDNGYNPNEEHKLQEKGTANKKVSGHILINKSDDPRAKWYVVHTASGHEVRVAETLRQRVETTGLEDKIFELLVPTQDRVIIRSGKKQNIKEKIFPGYLLVKLILDDPTWLAVRTTPGITGFVGTGKTPSPLSDMEVANIQKFVATPAKRFKTKFSKGEAVKITDGPFSGFLGSVDDIDEQKGKVKVLVSIFGRETPVELDLLQITKV